MTYILWWLGAALVWLAVPAVFGRKVNAIVPVVVYIATGIAPSIVGTLGFFALPFIAGRLGSLRNNWLWFAPVLLGILALTVPLAEYGRFRYLLGVVFSIGCFLAVVAFPLWEQGEQAKPQKQPIDEVLDDDD